MRGPIERGVAPTHHSVNGVDGFLTCDLARGVPTHSIGHDVEPQDVVNQECVLVQLSALAYIGQSRTVVLQLVPSFSSDGR